jgi:hypothetical protein
VVKPVVSTISFKRGSVMKKCPACNEVIRFKVVPKETFPVNVMSEEEYTAYRANHPKSAFPPGSVGAFCNGCGIELIDLIPQKKGSRHNPDRMPPLVSDKV